MGYTVNIQRLTFIISAILLSSAVLVQPSFAEGHDSKPSGPPGHHRTGQPPQIVIDSCAGHKSGDSCTFEGHRGQVTGVCEHTPNHKYFACNPHNGSHDRSGKGPKHGADKASKEPGDKNKKKYMKH